MPGPQLTPIGRQEAVQTAFWLGGRGIERLFASPFDRTRATAEAIGAQLGLEIGFTEALREGGPGETMERIGGRMAELLAQLDDSPLRIAASKHATLYALDAETGKELYSSGEQIASFAHWGGLSVANGHVYLGTYDSVLYSFGLPGGGARAR